MFKFELHDKARLTDSGETGRVMGRAEYTASENSYLIRYRQADGVQTQAWWDESALEEVV